MADAPADRSTIVDLASDAPADSSADVQQPVDINTADSRATPDIPPDISIDQAYVRDAEPVYADAAADAAADWPAAFDAGYDLTALADVGGARLDGDRSQPDASADSPVFRVDAGDASTGSDCSPALPGIGCFTLAGTLDDLLADPSAPRLYALNTATPSEIVVIDTAQKRELTRITLAGQATDLDISPDGAYLVASLGKLKRLAVVDKTTWTVKSVGTVVAPQAIQVGNGGIAYYVDTGSWAELHRIELDVGIASDTMLGNLTVNDLDVYMPDIQLSPDGAELFLGESGSSGSNLYGLNVTGAIPTHAGKSNWDDGYGFSYAEHHVYLGPNGKHIYYAGYQLDANNLGLVLGRSGKVLAESAAGTWAVSTDGILDATLLTPVVALPGTLTAAALTASDAELWFYGAGRMSYANMADLVAGKVPGARETAALSLEAYTFTKLVADPKRPRLYGMDPQRRVVVSIDSANHTALRSVMVGSSPTDLVIDPSGTYLYVGHLETLGLAQIDVETLGFLQYITTPRLDYDIAPLGSTRIATIDADQWTSPTLIDVSTGKVLDSVHWGAYTGSVAATADGNTLFVGDMLGPLTRYDVSDGKFREVASTADDTGGGNLIATPDGSSVFCDSGCFDGTTLAFRYHPTDKVRSITPNSALAITANSVFHVSDGTKALSLSTGCSTQALDSTGETLYCAQAGGIVTVDLRGIR
jgi:DNA-binding beta-propeller fold protein YncE